MANANTVEMGVKLYLNGFPKAGTHALSSMGAALLPAVDPEHNWLGNLEKNAFGTEWYSVDRVLDMLDKIPPARFVKGHMGWTEEIAKAFVKNEFCKVFIYRDFRDVAVSTAFHATRGNAAFPEKEFYQGIKFDEMLTRTITGDENIASVMERWEMFAPWLDEDWVLKIAYDDLINYPREVAGLFIRYLFGRTARYHDLGIELSEENYALFADGLFDRLKKPEGSLTFRNGKTNEWKKYFTDEHKSLFKDSDTNNWLTRLGYENDRNW